MNLRRLSFFTGLFVLLLAAHLAHSGVLWEGDVLPASSALQLWRGATLYKDVWFDKPPLVSAIYLLWGAQIGVPLRVAGAVYAWFACLLCYLGGTAMWTRREGYLAAGLMGFFLTFDTHSGVVPLASDMLLLVPHLAAVWLAYRKQPLWSGLAAGVGFLFSAKAVFVLAVAALFCWPGILPLAAAFAIPNIVALGWFAANGSMAAYLDQVWYWPGLYAGSPVVSDPVWNGVVRSLNWFGFHAVLLIGASLVWAKRPQWRFAVWALVSYVGVTAGWRFFPRYFLLLLPPLVMAAAHGLASVKTRWVAVLALATMVVPLVRFGPKYIGVAGSSDLALDRDSREAAKLAMQFHPKTLHVWGYRPELFVYSGLRPVTRWLDSQALTGVPADRHLTQSGVVMTRGTAEARAELARTRPDVIIDGLGNFNPALAMDKYPELREWIAGYRVAGQTHGTVIYIRR